MRMIIGLLARALLINHKQPTVCGFIFRRIKEIDRDNAGIYIIIPANDFGDILGQASSLIK